MRRLAVLFVLLTACAPHDEPRSTLATIERVIGAGNGPILVLLHGYGSAPETFLSLTARSDLPAGTMLVLPRAPLAIPNHPDGTMWWPLPDHFAVIPHQRTPGLDAATDAVRTLVEATERAHPDRPLILGGFSQGAITTLDVALHAPALPLAGIVLLSGTMSDESGTMTRLDSRRGLHVFASHGRADDVLSYTDDARLVEAMRAHGLDVSFTSFDGGHVVTPQISNEMAAFVTQCATH